MVKTSPLTTSPTTTSPSEDMEQQTLALTAEQPEVPTDSSEIAAGTLAGFRLERLEVLHWGTFDKRPWALDLKGGTALLTGANGSGKSTLVDALLTLLVPNRRRSYNQASSGVKKKKERDERSYVLGAFARTRSQEGYESRSKYLREKGKPSILMAYFCDRSTGKDVSLAQVLWVDSTVRKFFVIADMELKAEYFMQCGDIPILKKQLKENDAEVYDNFTKYAQQFRKRFGLQSDKALDLFNQTVSIKEIGGLNEFVRNHMLKKADMQTQIEELQESYENLTISHTAIQKARRQLEALEPLTKEAKRYQKLTKDVADWQHFRTVLPAFFAGKCLVLLSAEQTKIERELVQGQHRREGVDRTLETLRQQAKELEFAIRQDSTGQRLQALAQEIEQVKKSLAVKQNAVKEYEKLADLLGLSAYRDSETFYRARAESETLALEITVTLQELEAQRDKQKLIQAELKSQQQRLQTELTSLRGRKNQIPKTNLDIRDRLAQALNIDATTLPFVGERLRVRDDAKDWEGAIERLLHGFGLCLLVPDDYYRAVNDYVNKTHLRGRLVYYRVGELSNKATQRRTDDPRLVPARLEVKQDEKFFPWLRDRLSQQFNYVCCDTVEQFQREAKAITQSGLIKQGRGRHEKDDRSKIGDRSRYILGWDNASKIQALEAELATVEQQLAGVAQAIVQIEKQQGQQRSRQAWLQDFMRFVDFEEIDWRRVDTQRESLEAQRKALQDSSDSLKQLEAQLKGVQAEITQASHELEQAIRALQTLRDHQSTNEQRQQQCQTILKAVDAFDITAFEKQMAKKLKPYDLSLETIASDESHIKDVLQRQLSLREQQQIQSRSAVEKHLFKFKTEFVEETLDLDSTYESLEGYLALKKRIEQDDLPRHEKRFRALMNDKIVVALSLFKNNLVNQEEEIKAAIERVVS